MKKISSKNSKNTVFIIILFLILLLIISLLIVLFRNDTGNSINTSQEIVSSLVLETDHIYF